MSEFLPRSFSREATLPARLALLALLCLGAFLFTASAQTSRGTVTGTVIDPNKAPVPSAIVSLVNAKGGPTRETTTNSQGLYLFDEVDPGTYSVAFSASEYPELTKTGVRVVANQTAPINAELLIAGTDISISVDGTADNELQREAPVRGGNLSGIQITDLPLANRNPVSFGLILPGFSTNRGAFADGSFSADGARDRSNNFLIDSTENNDISIAGQGVKITNPDSVQEVSFQASNFDSDFGRSGGAVINVITKSGSNALHGTLSYLLDSRRDDALTSSESRNPANVANGLPFGIQNIYSFTLGGPIRKDRTFFFTSYQEDRKRSNAQVQLTVPTAAGRALLRQVFPAGTSSNADLYLNATEKTVGVASPFNLALGTVSGVDRGNVEFGTFFRNIPNNDTDKQFLVRVDHRLTERDNFSARLLLDRQAVPFGGTLGGSEFSQSQTFPGFDADNRKRYYNMLLTNTHVFSSTVTNVTRIAYNRIDLQFPVTDPSGPGGTLPRITVSNITPLGTPPNFPQGRIANNYVLQDTVTFLKGHHTFRTGVDLLKQISTQAAPYTPRGSVTFAASTGFTSFANFMDNFGGGSGGFVLRDIGSAVYSPKMNRTAAFFQDRWKASSALTVSAGLRYEYFGTPFNTIKTPAYTGLFNVDPATSLGPYALPSRVKADRNNFAPNIGLAYSPSYSSGALGFLLGDRKSVLRAGYYIGYDSFFNNITSNAAVSSPNIVSTRIDSSTAGRGTANFLSTIPTTAATLTPLSAQTLIDPNLVNPYYQRWSAGIQRQLAKKLVVDTAYVGSKGSKLYIQEDANPLVRAELRRGTPADYPVCTPGLGVAIGQATAAFPVGTLCPLSGRYDNLQGSRLVRTNGGSSSYHAAQIEVKRPFADNFIITGSYTYSKLISNADEVFASLSKGIANSPLFQTPSVFLGDRLDRAVSLFDRTHRAVITYVFLSPFLQTQQGIAGHVLGGWEVSGITTIESGVPYTVLNGVDSDGIGGNGSDRPDVNPNGKRGVRATPVLDTQGFIVSYQNPDDNNVAIDPSTAYFIANPTYDASKPGSVPRVGTLGRNTERTPGLRTFDLAFMKRSKVFESMSIEFRLELYNIFNHPQYGQASVSPFAPPGNPSGSNFIPASVSTSAAGRFLNPNTIGSDGGGRVLRYQIKLIF